MVDSSVVETGNPDQPSQKRRRTEQRQRVTRACDRCKSRKTRCSGKHPCTYCAQLHLVCLFEAEYRRGRLPSIEIDSEHVSRIAFSPSTPKGLDQLSVAGSSFEITRADASLRSPVSLQESQAMGGQSAVRLISASELAVNRPDSSALHSSRNSPEPSQNDRQGHYVGPSSGVSFLLRIQQKLETHQSSFTAESSIFTFGDRPLPDTDSSFFILPSRGDADAWVERYFGFASATHRYLHQPTVIKWLDELYRTHGAMRQAGSESRVAVLFMIFAQAEAFTKRNPAEHTQDTSHRFFAAAERQLSTEKGGIKLTSVQARLAQCLYLLSQSRINHCWGLFGTTAHLILALGIHRKRRVDSNSTSVEAECRKRSFWTAYNIDTYLSTALGRPRSFHDEDIDQEMPACINDSEIGEYNMPINSIRSQSQSIMTGAVAHNKLTKLLAAILRDLYGIRPPSSVRRIQIAERYKTDLHTWRQPLAKFLDSTGVDHSLFLPVFLRQRNVLNLAYWHAQILLLRPFLLNNFAGLDCQTTTKTSKDSHPEVARNVEECLQAAMHIVQHVDTMFQTSQLYSTYYFTQYFCFCAIVVIYVYAIQQRSEDPIQYHDQFEMALRCQGYLATIATPNSFAERYGVILEELRHEVYRHNAYLANKQSTTNALLPDDTNLIHASTLLGMHQSGGTQEDEVQGHDAEALNGINEFSIDGLGDLSPVSFTDQMTGWGNFEALVSGGLGSLEPLLSEEFAI